MGQKMYGSKYIYIVRRRNTEIWKFIKATKTEGWEKVSIPVISHMEWIEHYKNLLTEDRAAYKVNNQSHIYI